MDAQNSGHTPSLEMAYVLFMDIVAYSTLRMEEQQSVLSRFQEAVRNPTEFPRARAEDHLIRLPTGDGMALVFFGDPEAPARCALEVSRNLREHPEVKLRMGIHSGPVYRVADINANRNVAGGGINIAQRVMDCGDPGHILVSKATADVLIEVKRWGPLLHDLGKVRVKHGVMLHLHNLCRDGVGNSAVPAKIRDARKLKVRTISAGVVLLALAAVGIWLFSSHKVHALTDKD